jgi:hypothetical protein
MTEIALFLEMIKYIGFPAVIFAVWYLYHRSQVEFLKEILKEQAVREERNHETLKELIETMHRTVAVLSRMEFKIDSNTWCPYIKGDKK